MGRIETSDLKMITSEPWLVDTDFQLGIPALLVGKDRDCKRVGSRAIPSRGIVSERSSPSRVRFAAQNAPLTAPGRSEHLSARKE